MQIGVTCHQGSQPLLTGRLRLPVGKLKWAGVHVGLTPPSSATAYGAVDVGYRETPTAMSRSLERVVRRRDDATALDKPQEPRPKR